jgi:alpha-D-xyloside xylohydrolase
MLPFAHDGDDLLIRFNGETIRITPHGPHALRVRARPGLSVAEPHVSALLPATPVTTQVEIDPTHATITNGRIMAEVRLVRRHGADVSREPLIRFLRAETGAELLSETRPHFAGPGPRAFKAISSGSFRLEATFAARDGEHIMGLGQPQHGRLDLKGISTALVQQNTHVVVPFVISSAGYGFLWNNPATGRADFAANITRWTSDATPGLDYWITAADTPAEILSAYLDATGRPPMLPDWATGFWQCKLRYKTQEELLSVARRHIGMGLPLSCIVIDFFAWSRQGEWKFDPAEWPDPEGLVCDLREMGVETIVSIWPTVGVNSENWSTMRESGFLLRGERGVPALNLFPDKDPYGLHFLTYYDAFNPAARDFHWDIVKRNYLDRGIRNFWLDSCEPEIRPAHAEHLRTALGNGAEMLCAYPKLHADRYAEGLKAAGVTDAVLLTRSSWAGGQSAPIILWSGDVWSNWQDFAAQIAAGCHAAMSGIGWWTTDIGGFYDGHGGDPDFRELLVRWFEFGVMSPICRLHGFRVPDGVPLSPPGQEVDYGRDLFSIFTDTGGDNEVWSYGDDVLAHARRLLTLRENLRPYLKDCFRAYSDHGLPPMQPLAFAFPGDAAAHAPHHYMLGPDILCAPVVTPGARERALMLPAGDWRLPDGTALSGGQTHVVPAPLGRPVVVIRSAAWDHLAPAFAV